jgi:hypothetical protein
MQIALSKVMDAARQRLAAVTAEVAGYLVLLASQQVSARPRRVLAAELTLDEAGEILVTGEEHASVHDVEVDLRRLLASLTALSQSPPPALRAAAERSAAGDLAAFEAELSAALIPLNPAASRRALARLYRETQRADGAPGGERVSTPGTPRVSPVLVVQRPTVATEASPPPLAAAPVTPLPPEAMLSRPSTPEPFTVAPLAETAGGHGQEQRAAEHEPSSEAPSLGAWNGEELNIEVDVDEPPSAPCSARLSTTREADVVPTREAPSAQPRPYQSDLSELLEAFLAHTRSDERMSADLRRMVGVDAGRVGPIPPTPSPRQ